VARVLLTLFLLLPAWPAAWARSSQSPEAKSERQPPAKAQPKPGDDLKEEDTTLTNKEYVFNPLQATNEIRVGKFYMKRGSFKAAAGRFEEALQWNPQEVEACTLLGEAREKLKDRKAARAAYEKCLGLGPDEKLAADLQRRLKRLD
jgi:tetratricopeptide (TPR) repeat protein